MALEDGRPDALTRGKGEKMDFHFANLAACDILGQDLREWRKGECTYESHRI